MLISQRVNTRRVRGNHSVSAGFQEFIFHSEWIKSCLRFEGVFKKIKYHNVHWPSCVTKHHGNTDRGLPVFHKCFKLCLPFLCLQCISHIVESLLWGQNFFSPSNSDLHNCQNHFQKFKNSPIFKPKCGFCVTGSDSRSFYRLNRHSQWTRAERELKDAWSSSFNVFIFFHMGLFCFLQ